MLDTRLTSSNESEVSMEQNGVKADFKKHGSYKWITVGVCISLFMAIIFTALYGIFGSVASENISNPLESEEQLSSLYENSYLLYRDLFNRENQTNLSFNDLYLEPAEGYEWLLDEETANMAEYDFMSQLLGEAISENADVNYGMHNEYLEIIAYFNNYFAEYENNFTRINNTYDYVIEDLASGEVVTNLTATDINLEEQFFCVTFLFDENGNVSLGGALAGNDITKLRKNANEAIRSKSLYNLMQDMELIQHGYLKIKMPRNCRVTFCISNLDWNRMENEGIYTPVGYSVSVDKFDAYIDSCGNVYLIFWLLLFLAGMYLPVLGKEQPFKDVKICRLMSLEGLILIAYLNLGLLSLTVHLVMWVDGGNGMDSFASLPRFYAWCLVYGLNILAIAVFFFVPWYLGVCARAVRELGLREYIKQKSIIYRIFPTAKAVYEKLYDEAAHFDVTRNAKKLICKIVITNGIVLFIIGCFPLGGLAVALIYSVMLYFVLKKYISDLQKKYSILLKSTNEIAEGNLNGSITEDLGVFEPFKPQVIRIQNGFKKAVEEEVKSQRMKSELITNVSHDLKTPLTAIITYINLLKDENITDKQRREYLDTLERKSLRLKVLIEDLFEVSKANSQNLTLNIMDVDLVNLLKQVSLEMSDKLKENQLDVRMDLPEEKIILPLDSQKTYRIFENLLGNVAKYALSGTRVYLQCRKIKNQVTVVLKNITAQEIQVNAEELTERFVRGDVSRNTEGSGLGLAIAKSFTELQGGSFKIDLDGDLFKVTVFFFCENFSDNESMK